MLNPPQVCINLEDIADDPEVTTKALTYLLTVRTERAERERVKKKGLEDDEQHSQTFDSDQVKKAGCGERSRQKCWRYVRWGPSPRVQKVNFWSVKWSAKDHLATRAIMIASKGSGRKTPPNQPKMLATTMNNLREISVRRNKVIHQALLGQSKSSIKMGITPPWAWLSKSSWWVPAPL